MTDLQVADWKPCTGLQKCASGAASNAMTVLAQTAEVPQRPEYAVANEWPNQRGSGEHHQRLVLALSTWKALGHRSGAQCGGTREPRLRFCSEAQGSTEQRLRE